MSSRGPWTANASSRIHVIGIARPMMEAFLPGAISGELMKTSASEGMLDQQQLSSASSFDSQNRCGVCLVSTWVPLLANSDVLCGWIGIPPATNGILIQHENRAAAVCR